MKEGVLSIVGNTPLIALTRVVAEADFRLYGKLEQPNPGGSIKDRSALAMLVSALRRGSIRRDTTIVESSSGNMGIGLAQACAYLGLRFICVIDPRTTRQNVSILRAYGAEIDLVSTPDPARGGFVQARIKRVKQLRRSLPHAFWPNQYANLSNALAHRQTMREILSQLGGQLDYLFCATSTCGTLRGCAEYARQSNARTRIIAVDAIGSVIFEPPDQQPPATQSRLVPGHGSATHPPLFSNDLADACIHVSDLDCVVGCRRLVRREGILAGGSSGGVVMAVEHIKRAIPRGATCAVVLADRGERYLDTIYSDAWVQEHFGDVSHLWEQGMRTPRVSTRPECLPEWLHPRSLIAIAAPTHRRSNGNERMARHAERSSPHPART